EPGMVDVTTTPAPRKISRMGARAGYSGANEANCVFKVVNMYSIPSGYQKRRGNNFISEREPYPDYPRQRSPSIDSRRVDGLRGTGGRNYPSGRPMHPVQVTAGLGNYLIIYSETIMAAIRSCVKVYPGISRAFEFMAIPAPYTLIVHY